MLNLHEVATVVKSTVVHWNRT